MGIFDFLINKNQNQENKSLKSKDERKAECPNCHKTLSKIPGAKTKCPHCGEFMFIRTRPKDNARVVVTKAGADKIDEEWSIVAGTHDILLRKKRSLRKRKKFCEKDLVVKSQAITMSGGAY